MNKQHDQATEARAARLREEINSHIFLIERSTAYTNFISQQEEIAALAPEITDLRAQNLELVADMINVIEGFEQSIEDITASFAASQ